MDGTIAAGVGLGNREASLDALYADMADLNLFGYWARTKTEANDETNVIMKDTPKAIPWSGAMSANCSRCSVARPSWCRRRTPNVAR